MMEKMMNEKGLFMNFFFTANKAKFIRKNLF